MQGRFEASSQGVKKKGVLSDRRYWQEKPAELSAKATVKELSMDAIVFDANRSSYFHALHVVVKALLDKMVTYPS